MFLNSNRFPQVVLLLKRSVNVILQVLVASRILSSVLLLIGRNLYRDQGDAFEGSSKELIELLSSNEAAELIVCLIEFGG
jgi:hypothetical protein